MPHSAKVERDTDGIFLRRIVGEVEEEGGAPQAAVLFEIAGEEAGGFQVHTHSGEYDSEVVLVAVVYALVAGTLTLDETGLSANLGGNLVMRETGGGEDGNLLATGDRVHGVDGGNTSRDHLLGVHLVDGR